MPDPHWHVERALLTWGFRIEGPDLRAQGYTRMCPKSDAIRAGRQAGIGHSTPDRQRLRSIFEASGDSCVERAQALRGAGGVGPLPQAEGEGLGAHAAMPHAPGALALDAGAAVEQGAVAAEHVAEDVGVEPSAIDVDAFYARASLGPTSSIRTRSARMCARS